ncbi:MAG TPA: sulfotransferase [Thermodesulfobacteriota bacterium]|nr:sulfotransferase [Thermodesulfobacteriota bacterium]
MNMRSQVIVLGMHRSGTSLIASILHLSGISMGKEFLRPDNGNPGGYFEDLEFLNLNKTILTQAEGTWRKPPSKERISISGSKNKKYIKELVFKRMQNNQKWGWKDPRTSLTGELFLEFLPDIKLIHVIRDENAIINSLAKLHGGQEEEWKNLNILYLQRIEEFKDKISPQFVHVVTYENLLNNKLAPIEVEKLVTFAHSRPRTKVDAWLRLINPNK